MNIQTLKELEDKFNSKFVNDYANIGYMSINHQNTIYKIPNTIMVCYIINELYDLLSSKYNTDKLDKIYRLYQLGKSHLTRVQYLALLHNISIYLTMEKVSFQKTYITGILSTFEFNKVITFKGNSNNLLARINPNKIIHIERFDKTVHESSDSLFKSYQYQGRYTTMTYVSKCIQFKPKS